jgi:hypothetical protein
MREQRRVTRRVGSWNMPWSRETDRTPQTITQCVALVCRKDVTEAAPTILPARPKRRIYCGFAGEKGGPRNVQG